MVGYYTSTISFDKIVQDLLIFSQRNFKVVLCLLNELLKFIYAYYPIYLINYLLLTLFILFLNKLSCLALSLIILILGFIKRFLFQNFHY